jgi:hypothetical protein
LPRIDGLSTTVKIAKKLLPGGMLAQDNVTMAIERTRIRAGDERSYHRVHDIPPITELLPIFRNPWLSHRNYIDWRARIEFVAAHHLLVRATTRRQMKLATKNNAQENLADDLLRGADEIAGYLYGDSTQRRKVYHLAETSRLPVFRLGSKLCARRSILIAWIASQERRGWQGDAPDGPGSPQKSSSDQTRCELAPGSGKN